MKNMTNLRTLYLQRKQEGVVQSMAELGERLWPDSPRESMLQNVHKLFSGKTKRIDLDWIPIICDWLKVDANTLFINYQEDEQ